MENDLVNGYIKEIEKLLENDKIIPMDIYRICFDFYFTTKLIFYLAGLSSSSEDEVDDSMDIMSAANLETKQFWEIEIQDLDSDKTPITIKNAVKGKKWVMDYAGITFTRNLRLPSLIKNKIDDSELKFNNVIFRCGGEPPDAVYTDYCAALIFDSHRFSRKKADSATIAYNWKLPDLPAGTTQNVVVYADKARQLFSIGGEQENDSVESIYALSFDDASYFAQDLNEWKWTKLELELTGSGGLGCATMIDKDKTLVVIGSSKNVDMFHLVENEKIEVKDRFYNGIDCGVYYDEYSQEIFVGGGYHAVALKTVEFYDIEKDLWSKLPDTNNAHDMNPLFWIEDHNVLHVVSVYSNSIECMDLREAKEWRVKVAELSALFGTSRFRETAATSSRLVGN